MWTCVFLVYVTGVFGVDADEVKSVSVMEGDSVTLHTHLTDIQRKDRILWIFGPQEPLIAKMYKQNISMFDSKEIFGGRLKLDSQTGELTITNLRITDSGLYQLHVISDRGTSYESFNVSVNYKIQCFGFTGAVVRLVLAALVGVATIAVVVYDVRTRRAEQKQRHQTSHPESD